MDIKSVDKLNIANTYSRQDIAMVKGKGAICVDDNNKSYIDFGSGIGVNSLGFCDDEWSNAVSKQVKTLQHCSNYYYSKPASELAQKLCSLTFANKVFFANSGAEANEGAIKVARKYSFDKYGDGRNKIITLVNSFHGRTITTLSATGQDVFHNSFFPFTEGFDYVIANDVDDLNSKVDESVCAIMVEFVQGEGGVIPLDCGFVSAIAELCDKRDILLIADEVQTGIARTGKILASQNFSVTPDITTLAKGLGGGLPIGAVLLGKKTENVLQYGDHGTTFGGNPVSCAGANVVLDRVSSQHFLDEVVEKGVIVKKALSQINEVECVTGLGMMIGIKLKTKTAAEVMSQCRENGLIVLTAKEKVRLLPPLTITKDELEKGLEILIAVLNKC